MHDERSITKNARRFENEASFTFRQFVQGVVPSFTVLPPVYGEFHSFSFGGASPVEFSLGRRLGRRSVRQELLNCFRRLANWLSRSVRPSESFNRDSMLGQQSCGSSYVSGLLPSLGGVKQYGDICIAFCNHCPVDVLIVARQPM